MKQNCDVRWDGRIIMNFGYKRIWKEAIDDYGIGYVLDDRDSVSGRLNDVLHCVQIGSGTYPASYPMGTRSSFPF
jgi:hypothetical protein